MLPVGCKAIDAVTSRKVGSHFVSRHDRPFLINERPLSVLRALVSNDDSVGNIAKEPCISPITAHQHISAGTKANIGAALKAIRAGMINIDELGAFALLLAHRCAYYFLRRFWLHYVYLLLLCAFE
jgi:hypothetical protein